MNATPQRIKNKLHKELTALTNESINSLLADRVGCSSETVRLFFTLPSRKNEKVERAAFQLLAELREAQEEKLKKLES